jgi:hypothetical protein
MLQFCNKELQSPDLSEDAKESLEVNNIILLFNRNFIPSLIPFAPFS